MLPAAAPTGARFRRRLGAIVARAARRVARAARRRQAGRDDPQPVARSSRWATRSQATNVATALEAMPCGRCGCARIATACSSSRAGRRVEVPDLQEACDLVGFSYYSATGVDADGQLVPYPSRRAASARWVRAVERRARHRAPPAARRAARPAAARSASTASAPTTTNGGATSLRESLEHRRRRDRRRHRPARLLPLDRRRQLRVEPRLRRAVRLLHPRPRTPGHAPNCSATTQGIAERTDRRAASVPRMLGDVVPGDVISRQPEASSAAIRPGSRFRNNRRP